jgi:hypothetical protein
MTTIRDPKLRKLLAQLKAKRPYEFLQKHIESKPGTPGKWRRVLYQNGYWYVFEQRGSKLLLSKRPNDTAWVHKVDPSEVVEEP